MFRRQFFSWILLWLFCACACFWYFKNSSADARIAYQNLLSLNDKFQAEKKQHQEQPAQQTREGVSKQILYTKEGKRTQSRLSSEKSELVFDQRAGKGELIEHFKRLTCVLHDSSHELKQEQHYRRMNAQQAVYFYKNGELEAEEVVLADYLIPGELWPSSFAPFSPLLQGNAQKVRLSLTKDPLLQAQGFQASLYEWEGE